MDLRAVCQLLMQDQVIAYPTEAVFGLGCNPLSQSAVQQLLELKQRPVEKGLILIASELDLLLPYIDTQTFQTRHWRALKTIYKQPLTWIVPAKIDLPRFLTGQFNSIAVRLCQHSAVRQICENTGFALTSTSANLTGASPCRTVEQVRLQFGKDFPVLDLPVGKATNPSEIRDLFTDQIVRQG